MRVACVILSIALVASGAYNLWSPCSTSGPTCPAKSITVHFSPRGGCQDEVIRRIDAARTQILVQAYGFTSEPIAAALVRAKDRGIDVQVCADATAAEGRGSQVQLLSKHLPVWLDGKHAIAHSKVMMIDAAIVLTGSYNWTAGAEDRNLENLVTIHSPDLAAKYIANWNTHREHCTRLQAPACGCPDCECENGCECVCKPGQRCCPGCCKPPETASWWGFAVVDFLIGKPVAD